MERRLAAILAADVAGYSRLMGIDEEGTHKDLKAHCHELVEPKIQQHRGRMIKNTGDGFLAEFTSVLDAVRCATEIQQGMILRNGKTSDERRIEFRIGVHHRFRQAHRFGLLRGVRILPGPIPCSFLNPQAAITTCRTNSAGYSRSCNEPPAI